MIERINNVRSAFFLVLFALSGCLQTQNGKTSEASNCLTNPNHKVYFGICHVDEYGWIKNNYPDTPMNASVKSIIETENEKSAQFFKTHSDKFDHIMSVVNKFDYVDVSEIPLKLGPYNISTLKNNEDDEFYRLVTEVDGKETVLLDVYQRSKLSEYYQLVKKDASPSGDYFAWTEIVSSAENKILYVKSLRTDEIVYTKNNNITDFEFHPTDNALYYVSDDKTAIKVDIESSLETVIYQETQDEFDVTIAKSLDNQYLLIRNSTIFIREYLAHSFDSESSKIVIIPRSWELDAHIQSIDGKFYAQYSDENNSRLVVFELNHKSQVPSKDLWKTVYDIEAPSVIKDINYHKEAIMMVVRTGGLDSLLLYKPQKQEFNSPQMPEDFYSIWLRYNIPSDIEKGIYRFRYSSFLSPRRIGEVSLETGKVSFFNIESEPINVNDYIVERTHAISHDGVKVPVSIIRRKTTPKDGTAPVVVDVYGAYGSGIGPEFTKSAFALINKGFIFAIAHVRGGNELGKKWHTDGKLLKKANSFKDFQAVSEFLFKENYTTKGNISITGTSAAGLIIGVVLNENPSWYKSATVLVPFLDPLNVLLDDDFPYAKYDRQEFGNPSDSEIAFKYIKGYSPQDNITYQNYPHTYVTGGIDDPSAGFWEPIKWTLKKRKHNTSDSVSLVSTRGGGHFPNGHNAFNEALARQYTFIWAMHSIDEPVASLGRY